MSVTKIRRDHKRQLGQFLTPTAVAQARVDALTLHRDDKVLEPSMGDGAFVLPLIERFLPLYDGALPARLAQVLARNVYGVELDPALYTRCLDNIRARWGCLPEHHNFLCADFFRCDFAAHTAFTHIVGNPPFGGTLDPTLQDALDSVYGFRNGEKIKKESYAFFIVKSLDLLAQGGRLSFICSDTFLTIQTMRGLRRLLMCEGEVTITGLPYFSDETTHPMVVLDFVKRSAPASAVTVNGVHVPRAQIELTGNFSWRITGDLAKYFAGPVLGDYLIASSGMTVGKNAWFVREIVEGAIIEPYTFEFFADPITLDQERARARLGKLSPQKIAQVRAQEAGGATRRSVRIVPRAAPQRVPLPHPDYCYYNKGASAILYTPPTHVIYWKDDGDAVLTFKKNGPWYLHGVGGQPYFRREGLTWQLIAAALHTRYLPAGYILDSGAPCAFLRRGVAHDELYFILGWTLTRLCNRILKEVVNHTKNIQGKDFERLPYPFWVTSPVKTEIVATVRRLVEEAQRGRQFTRQSAEVAWLEEGFACPPDTEHSLRRQMGVPVRA